MAFTASESTQDSSTSLVALPDEVVQAIIQHLDAVSVVALTCSSRRFADIANEPLLWKGFCQRDFRYWDAKHVFRQRVKNPTFSAWKDLYGSRYETIRSTKDSITHMINSPFDRLQQVQSIVDNGYGVKDALIQILADAPGSEDFLARRYWANLVLGSVHRNHALQRWIMLKHKDGMENPTEVGLAAIDMFVIDASEKGDIDETMDSLDEIVADIRNAEPDILEKPPRQRAEMIARHLRVRNLIGISEGRRYHSLDNMFLGIALRSRHRNSLPLISAIIYCYLCRQFNLQAQPCSFPLHVHAVVQPPPGLDLDNKPLPSEHDTDSASELTHLYMDPFNTDQSIRVSELRQQITFIVPDARPDQVKAYLSPASPRELLFRSTQNILSSIKTHEEPPYHPIAITDAAYAALFACVLFPMHPATLHSHVRNLTQHFMHFFVHDLHLYEKLVLPLTTSFEDHSQYRQLCHAIVQEEQKPRQAKCRSREPYRVVEYKVGQMFRHRRRRYLAVIYGWDNECKMSNEWIMGNRVDHLPKGRDQPFYHVLVDDATTRYVAQENVILLAADEIHESDVRRFSIEIGKWFRRFDPDSGTFISNIKDEYPEE